MAKVTVTIDTEAKSLDVSIDGISIPNVKSVSAYQYRDSNGNANGIDVAVNVSENHSTDVKKETTYYAMGSATAEKIVNSKDVVYSKDIPNFVGVTTAEQVKLDIAAYLGPKLGKL